MSLIHQKLYAREDEQNIDMFAYLNEFIDYLRDSFSTQTILFEKNIEHLSFDLDKAIPLALIINEAITNAIKYAFPDERAGKITVELVEESGIVKLIIRDNGIGIDLKLTGEKLTSMGLGLIRGLGEDIDADVKFESLGGATVSILFPR